MWKYNNDIKGAVKEGDILTCVIGRGFVKLECVVSEPTHILARNEQFTLSWGTRGESKPMVFHNDTKYGQVNERDVGPISILLDTNAYAPIKKDTTRFTYHHKCEGKPIEIGDILTGQRPLDTFRVVSNGKKLLLTSTLSPDRVYVQVPGNSPLYEITSVSDGYADIVTHGYNILNIVYDEGVDDK
jgi:hypothetical protein